MDQNVNPMVSTPTAPGSVVQQAQQGTNAATASHGAVTGATTVSNMNQLRKVAPKLYKAMMMGVMMIILNQMENGQQRFKEIVEEGIRDSQGG